MKHPNESPAPTSGTPAADRRSTVPSKPGRLVPLSGLFALLTLALSLAGLMIPRQSELVDRLLEDGRHDRALALISGAESGEAGADAPSPAALVKMLLESEFQDFSQANQLRIDALVRITDDPAGVRQTLMEHRHELPSEFLPSLLDHLAVRAVHVSDPALAVSIYKDLEELKPLDVEQTTRMVAACRFSGNPRAALDAISRLLRQQRLPFSQLPDDLRMTTIALHREVNEGGEAFDLLSEEFKATLDPAQRHDLVELITTVAAQSSRLGDSLPILENYLTQTDAGGRDWRELAPPRPAAPSDDDFRRFGKMLAQHLEWSNRTSEAFDLYRKLAVMGDLESLDRCVTIYPWVDRQADLTELLEFLAPVAEREPYTLLLGRLQSERGKFPEAESIYRSELAGKHAKDPSVWSEFGGILNAQERFSEALEAYRTALTIDPDRHDIRVRLARLHVTLGNHSAALLAYRKLPDDAHDRKTREDYAMIAKSLDQPKDFIHAIQLKIGANAKPEPGDFLDIADAWDGLAEPTSVETTLREGLKRFPGSAPLILRLADHLAVQGRLDEAYEAIAQAGRLGDKRFSSRILGLGYELGRFDDTLKLVSGLPVEWSPSERMDLAALFEETGDLNGALTQYRLAEGGEVEAARLEAELAYLNGDIAGAVTSQAKYLALIVEPDSEAWTFMGDLLRAQGKSAEAEAAYLKALEQLKLQLARQPEAPPAPPAVAKAR